MAQATIQVFESGKQETELQIAMTPQVKQAGREIMEALSTFRYLTAEQLSRYLGLNHHYTQVTCQELTSQKYLLALTPTKQLQAGSVPYVYTLGAKGQRFVSEEGLEHIEDAVPINAAGSGKKRRFRPSEERAKTVTLLHSLAVNEVLVKGKLLERQDTNITLSRFVTELGFLEHPIKVETGDNNKPETVSLRPDLWLEFVRFGYRLCFCIEVNLTPVEQARWRQKVRAYLSSSNSYKERFGTDVIVIVTLVESSLNFPKAQSKTRQSTRAMEREAAEARKRRKRLEDLVRWTEAELTTQHAQDTGDHFLFSDLSLNAVTPSELFLRPVFLSAFSKTPEPMIPQVEEAESG